MDSSYDNEKVRYDVFYLGGDELGVGTPRFVVG
jgi:hypothetical protein